MDWLNSLILCSELQSELMDERMELSALGLTEEEIEGYIEYYWENWFPLLLPRGKTN